MAAELNAPGADAAPPTVLIADDDFGSRQILARLLRQFGHDRIHEARNGPDAVAEYRLRRPDICFLDIDMPGLNGLDVLKDIRETGEDAFVVIVSATGSLARVQQALALGVAGFVVKPYSARRIEEMLRKYGTQPSTPAALPQD